MKEKKIQTSAGMETASETVARAKAQLARVNSGKKTDPATAALTTGERPKNPIIEALTSKLISQAQGISTSASSNLQASINQAISETQAAGEMTNQRLQSEREREVSFAQDRASATFTEAAEGRTGYATQVAAFKELTETTEKSVRDLDKRYQEAMLANDAETARTIAGLRIEKLKFQMEQEENFFRNSLSLASMQQQEDQFYMNQLNENARFAVQMAQSNYQFEKNLGIQFRELELQEQELGIQRERNQIAWSEYSAKMDEINKEKNRATLAARVFKDMRNEVTQLGRPVEKLEPTAYATWLAENDPNIDFEEALFYAQQAQSTLATEGLKPSPAMTSGTQSAFSEDLSKLGGFFSRNTQGITSYFTQPRGSQTGRQLSGGYFSGGFGF